MVIGIQALQALRVIAYQSTCKYIYRQLANLFHDNTSYSNTQSSLPKAKIQKIYFFIVCGIKDSNLHSVRNQILSLARLPIPPMPRKSRISSIEIQNSITCRWNSGAKVLHFFELCKKIRKLFIIFYQMASKSCIDGRLLPSHIQA